MTRWRGGGMLLAIKRAMEVGVSGEISQGACLEPYRVLDVTQGGCLFCARLLGDLGADVIKIEAPGGDPSRSIGPFYKDMPDPEKSLFWLAYNANKRGVTLNLEVPDGQEIFKRLVRRAHFVIESFPPGYLDGLGLGYAQLREICPDLIVVSITPFGQSGPYARFKASDLIAWAVSGYLYVLGDPDRAPTWIPYHQATLVGGVEGAAAAMIAHYQRQSSGRGEHADVSIQEALVNQLFTATTFWDLNRINLSRMGDVWQIGSVVVPMTYACRDGYVSLLMLGGGSVGNVTSTRAFVSWMAEEGMAPEWLKSFDWVHEYDTMHMTQEVVDRVAAPVKEFFATRTRQECLEAAAARSIYMAPLLDAQGVCESPHLQSRGFWEQVEHPELGESVALCGPYAKLSETPLRIRRRAPLVGEHNIEVYGGELGYSREEMVLLAEAGGI